MADAQTWIGRGDANDKFDLQTIEAAVAPDASDLHAILRSAKISGLFRMRSEATQAAVRAQRSFKRLSAIAVFATAIATLTSGLLLYGAGAETGAAVAGLVRWVKDNHTAIAGIQVLALFLSAFVASMLASQNYIERWQGQRGRAELLRRQIFTEILTMAETKVPRLLPEPDPGNPIAQAFEFFRRYQHEMQITFYGEGSFRHTRIAVRLAWLTAILAGLAAITGVLGNFGGPALVASAFLGIAVPILLSAAQSWGAWSRGADKAAAYQKTKEALDTDFLNIDAVRTRAAIGDAAAVGAYVNKIHLIMATENEAWKPAARP
jgi:hypothetical protein